MIKKLLLKADNKYASRWLVLSIDLVIVLQAFILAYLIRFNFSLNFDFNLFLYQIPFVLLVALGSFLLIGSYKGVVRHTGQKDAVNVFFATSILAACLIISVLINRKLIVFEGVTIPLSIIIIHYLLNIFLLISSRIFFKIAFHSIINDLKPKTKVMIYGAGDSGFITHSALVRDKRQDYDVIGFIDDNKTKVGKTIDRIPVYSPDIIERSFVLKNRLKEVIVSIQNLHAKRLMEITDGLMKHNVTVKIVPAIDDWIDGELNVGQIKKINIDDLLGRAPININNPQVKRDLKNKTVFITGAAGSIGSEISRQVSECRVKKLVLIDQAESPLYDLQQEFTKNSIHNFVVEIGDVRDKKRMESLFKDYKPNIIFHAAAYKHVPLMENNPYEAIRVNVKGTKLLADLSLENNVEKFVMVSTDKAVNPTNIMGATKRIAEIYTSCLSDVKKTKFITTRFGNVLGSNGSVVPLFKKQLESGGPLTVTHRDITRYFMTIPEACQLVLEAGTMGNGGEVYVFDMGEAIKIYDVALKMIQLSGLNFPDDIDIDITGLRPGEKLYEELLANDENTQPTYHRKILIAKTPKTETKSMKIKIDALCDFNSKTTNVEIVRGLKDIVPEFKSNNSIYEKLDVIPEIN